MLCFLTTALPLYSKGKAYSIIEHGLWFTIKFCFVSVLKHALTDVFAKNKLNLQYFSMNLYFSRVVLVEYSVLEALVC